LPSTEKAKLNIANSIWFRDDERLQVKPGFLQKNADYYNAAAYKSPFDKQTLNDINNWVKFHTDGMIEKILEEINDDAVMYLINAVVFDAKWEVAYKKDAIKKGIFTDINGKKQNVDFMSSMESKYLDDGKATGFIKPYAGGQYSFAALLPNEGVSIEEYIASLTGEGFINTIKNAINESVAASMPKFSYKYEIEMSDALIALGMTDAFDGDKADFSRMATSSRGNIYIDFVKHKTFISVDELGTKAGAVTIVGMNEATSVKPQPKIVTLDRPFVYVIIDNATNLPIFIGTLMSVE